MKVHSWEQVNLIVGFMFSRERTNDEKKCQPRSEGFSPPGRGRAGGKEKAWERGCRLRVKDERL